MIKLSIINLSFQNMAAWHSLANAALAQHKRDGYGEMNIVYLS